MEKLDRGLVAVKSGSGYFLSWRLFGTDPQDTSFGFNVYRGTTKLNSAVITDSTNYLDSAGGSGTYTVKAVTGGVEGETSAPALVIDNGYLNIPITAPPSGTNLGGASYSYSANDASIGDLDGDGQYELVLKWDPSDARDNEMSGYTGTCILDAYKLDGTKMWRIDLGKNIRAGAHYTQFLVYDFDGDGMAEVAMKTAPGTKDGTGAFLKTGDAAGADNTAMSVRRERQPEKSQAGLSGTRFLPARQVLNLRLSITYRGEARLASGVQSRVLLLLLATWVGEMTASAISWTATWPVLPILMGNGRA
jgi:hypothetical protein